MRSTETGWRNAFGHSVAIGIVACLWACSGTDACRAQQATAEQPGQPQAQASTELITQLPLLAQQPSPPQENAAKAKRAYRYRCPVRPAASRASATFSARIFAPTRSR